MFSYKSQVERFKSEQNLRKWKGSVIGGDEEIKKALKSLGREPKNAEELESEIFKQKGKQIQTTLNKSKYSLW